MKTAVLAWATAVVLAGVVGLFAIHVGYEVLRIRRMLRTVIRKGKAIMAIGTDILEAVKASRDSQDVLSNTVTQLSGTVERIVTAIEGLVAGGTISAETAAEILGTAQADKAAADAATATAATANQALSDALATIDPPPAPTT